MIVTKPTYNYYTKVKTATQYSCDMCHKIMEKPEKITLYTSNAGDNKPLKKYDLCKKCMKTIEKNVKLWYDRIINKENN
jgi:hypothetical protein